MVFAHILHLKPSVLYERQGDRLQAQTYESANINAKQEAVVIMVKSVDSQWHL